MIQRLAEAAAAATRSRVPEQLRRQVLARDHYICAYCGLHADQVDHRDPAGRGGLTLAFNLTACCGDCNRRKGDRTKAEWDAAEAAKLASAARLAAGRPRLDASAPAGRGTGLRPRPRGPLRRLGS